MRRRLAAGLCAAAALAGFAVGRLAPSPEAPPAPGELAAALRQALAGGDSFERFERSAALLRHLEPGSLPEVVAVYEEMLPLIGPEEARLFVAAWARLDPAAALDHVHDWGAKAKQEAGAEAALEAWARMDPSRAKQAYQEDVAAEPRLGKPLLAGLVTGWVHSEEGPEALGAFLLELEPASREEAIGVAIRELARAGGPEDALTWADAFLRNGNLALPLKRTVFRRVLRMAARLEPERAAAWAAGHADRPYGADGPPIVAAQWRDGAAALAWLRDQPTGAGRDEGVRRAFARWSKADPTAAKAWLDAEAQDALREPALAAFAAERADEEPEEGLRLCEGIRDEARALRCRVDAASRWYQRDAKAAEAWLAESPLDEGARRQVRMPPRARRTGPGPRPRAGQ